MQLFSQILFPTDLSEASNHAMKYAIHLCRQSKANLLILYAYRLIDDWSLVEGQTHGSLKAKLEMQAKTRFSMVEKEMLSATHIQYQFLPDVGFLHDRILVNIQTYQVDLLLFCHKMQQALADSMQDLLIKQEKCPVMFIPPHFVQLNQEFLKLYNKNT